MSAFSNAGIYVFLDIDTFTTQIEETDPTWTLSQFQAFQKVIDAFAGYDNIVGFFIANEVPSLPKCFRQSYILTIRLLISVGSNNTQRHRRSALRKSSCKRL